MKLLLWFGLLSCVFALAACSNPEATIPADLVVNGTVISGVARLHGSGYSVPVATLAKELDWTTDTQGRGTFIITIQGKRFLLGSAGTGISFDHQIGGPVEWLGRELQLYQSQLIEIIRLSYPGGKVYKEGEKIYILTL